MLLRTTFISALAVAPIVAQTPQPRNEPQPLYRVTIVQRTTPAINYGHKAEPTEIDFRGTPLLQQAKGTATVESKRGATLVDAHFDHVAPPTRFGAEFLTYVVWAISPEGRAQNLGELVVDGSNKGSLKSSTNMQAFALIVTAEPYFSVTQPSDVVVMENAIRPETIGKVEEVNATYELLPRKEFTYAPSAAANAASGGPPVSMDEYESITAIYQAQNAIQIARLAGADRYAQERLQRAQQLLDQARQLPAKRLSQEVVSTAREAAQVAEDARTIAVKRSEEDRLAKEHREVSDLRQQAEQERASAEAALQRAQAQASLAAAEQARAEASAARAGLEAQRPSLTQQPTASANRLRTAPVPDPAPANRARLLRDLTAAFETRDTPRGLVVVIPDAMLQSAAETTRERLSHVASAVRQFPGLRFDIEGNMDSSESGGGSFSASQRLAEQVREMLVAQGLSPSSVTARGYGSERPVAPNNTAAGREQNRRVEVVISGSAIGSKANWDRTYGLTGQ